MTDRWASDSIRDELSEDRRNALDKIHDEFAEHVKYGDPLITGFTTVLLDQDVHLLPWGIVMHAGSYFLDRSGEHTDEKIKKEVGDEYSQLVVYQLTLVDNLAEQVEKAAKEAGLKKEVVEGENGKQVTYTSTGGDEEKKTLNIHATFQLSPVMVSENRPITLMDVGLWYAAYDYEEAGDHEAARKLVSIITGVDLDEKQEDEEKYKPVHPKTHYDPDTKLADNFTSEKLFADDGKGNRGVSLRVSGDHEPDVYEHVEFALEDGDVTILNGDKHLRPEDRNLQASITSLMLEGGYYMTVNDIARAMGIKDPGKTQQKRIEDGLKRHARVMAQIDLTEVAQHYAYEDDQGEPLKQLLIKGHLLDYDMLEFRFKGQTITVYHMLKFPMLYQGAKKSRRIVSYPQRLIDEIGKKRSLTTMRQNLMYEVLRRIARMKNNAKQNRRINYYPSENDPKYRGMFEKYDIDTKNRKKTKAAADFVCDVLDVCVEQGYINGYEEVKDKRTGKRLGVLIDVDVKPRRKKLAPAK